MKSHLSTVVLVSLVSALIVCSCSNAARIPVVDENPVNLGFGRVSKEANPFSVKTLKVKAEETVYSNMYDYLRGKVPGLVVSNDAHPVIRIRGNNSINSGEDPLILVNGIATDDLSTVNPKDVDNVSVLKDSSCSIYGMRGANGVIIITLK